MWKIANLSGSRVSELMGDFAEIPNACLAGNPFSRPYCALSKGPTRKGFMLQLDAFPIGTTFENMPSGHIAFAIRFDRHLEGGIGCLYHLADGERRSGRRILLLDVMRLGNFEAV